MKLSLLFASLSVYFLSSVSAVVLECEFGYDYSCLVNNPTLILSKDDRAITAVNGGHETNRTNDDVNNFYSYGRKINYFPREVTKFLKNIETVNLNYAGLKELTKDDLQQFGDKLKTFWVPHNDIKVIEGNLFEYNQNLDWIVFNDNKIKHVEVQAFSHLEKLSIIHLGSNPCITFEGYFASNNHSVMLEHIANVTATCSFDTILTTKPSKFFPEKFSTLTEQILALTQQMLTLTQLVEGQSSKISTLEAKLDSQCSSLGSELKLEAAGTKKLIEDRSSALEGKLSALTSALVSNVTRLNENFDLLDGKILKIAPQLSKESKKQLEDFGAALKASQAAQHSEVASKLEKFASLIAKLDSKVGVMGSELGRKIEEICKREDFQ